MKTEKIQEFQNIDCMEGMRTFPDKYFDLAIVDPPYGIGATTMTFTNGDVRKWGNAAAERRDYSTRDNWDTKPDAEYFKELQRVSKRQIIWGGNYFSDLLPPSKTFIIWDKRLSDACKNSFSDCEYAWCSEGMGVARIFRYLWSGMIQGDMKNKEERFHPTQKPVALYLWLLNRYAIPGWKILDTHVGSASSLIACEKLNFNYTGYEINKDYYRLAKERIDESRNQITVFDNVDDANLTEKQIGFNIWENKVVG